MLNDARRDAAAALAWPPGLSRPTRSESADAFLPLENLTLLLLEPLPVRLALAPEPPPPLLSPDLILSANAASSGPPPRYLP